MKIFTLLLKLLKRLKPFSNRDRQTVTAKPQPPIVTAISRLPKSAGTASQLFDELWNRTGNQAGEVTATVREMIGWNENFTDSKIRHWLRTLETLGYIIVEETGKHSVKRILVNQPTRLVHEYPLFDCNFANRDTVVITEITKVSRCRILKHQM
jgi:hypothetical protein